MLVLGRVMLCHVTETKVQQQYGVIIIYSSDKDNFIDQ